MEYSLSVKEVLDTLSPSYKSIDLRAILVALGDGQGWQSVWTIIRFSSKTDQEVSKEHDALRQTHNLPAGFLSHRLGPEFNMKPFKGMNVELSAYPVDTFSYLGSRLDDGIVNCGERSFRAFSNVSGGFKLLDKMMTWRNDSYATDNDKWPVYRFGEGDQGNALSRISLDEHALNRWAREVEFSSFREMCGYLLGAFFGQGQNFEIRAPIYTRIDEVKSSEKSVWVQGQFHQQLGALSLELSLARFDSRGYGVSQSNLLGKVPLTPESQGEAVVSFNKKFVMEPPPELGRVTAVLFNPKPRRVDLSEQSADVLKRTPTFKVFSSFIPEEHLTEYLSCLASGRGVTGCQLYQRFTPKDSSKKIDEILEHVTNYLLALCGLNPIPLSNPRYDVLTGGMNAGSADVLAMTPERDPILVSCTMAMPVDRKHGMLLSARTAICQRVSCSEDSIKLLLITGKPSVPRSSATEPILTPKTTVRMLAAEDLKRLWEMIQQGDISGARSLLGLAATGS